MVVRRVNGTYDFLKLKVNICYSRDGIATDPIELSWKWLFSAVCDICDQRQFMQFKNNKQKSTFLAFLP